MQTSIPISDTLVHTHTVLLSSPVERAMQTSIPISDTLVHTHCVIIITSWKSNADIHTYLRYTSPYTLCYCHHQLKEQCREWDIHSYLRYTSPHTVLLSSPVERAMLTSIPISDTLVHTCCVIIITSWKSNADTIPTSDTLVHTHTVLLSSPVERAMQTSIPISDTLVHTHCVIIITSWKSNADTIPISDTLVHTHCVIITTSWNIAADIAPVSNTLVHTHCVIISPR